MTTLKVVNLYDSSERNSVALLLENGEKVYITKNEFIDISKNGLATTVISDNDTIYTTLLDLKKNGDEDFYIVVAVKQLKG